MEFIRTLFSSSGFMPHGVCYLWTPGLVWLHVLSDSLIVIAYASIPVTLLYFVHKRKDVPFNWMFLCFGLFILGCGATHALEVWTIWHPTYWLSGAVKLATALASVTTAILLVNLIPDAVALPSTQKLRLEVAQRTRAEEALSRANRRLIQAHEEERTRIARELHDDIQQRVALLAVRLDPDVALTIQNAVASNADLKRTIGEAHKEIAELGRDIQALSHRLHSSKLEYVGLTAAASSFCRELADSSGFKIDFQVKDVPSRLPIEISLSLFRVLQEALQNATKHSGSRSVQVSLIGSSNRIDLIVRDFGNGFNSVDAAEGRGLGLISMRERMKLIGGEVSIESASDLGTTVHAGVAVAGRLHGDDLQPLSTIHPLTTSSRADAPSGTT